MPHLTLSLPHTLIPDGNPQTQQLILPLVMVPTPSHDRCRDCVRWKLTASVSVHT